MAQLSPKGRTPRGVEDSPVVLVTGAGAGLGEATARLFASRGWLVAVSDVDREMARTVADALDGAATAFECDVADTAAIEEMLRRLGESWRRLDCVVNNAGIIRPAPSHEVSDKDWDLLLSIHLGGTFRVSRAALPLLSQSVAPAIVNLSSVCATRGFPARLSYNAAKAGIESVTRTLAVEWGPIGVRVNAVAPGFILTAASQAFYDAGGADLSTRESLVPLGRLGRPEEIAETIYWLASPAASYITGEVIAVDGGYLIDGRTGPDPTVYGTADLRASLGQPTTATQSSVSHSCQVVTKGGR